MKGVGEEGGGEGGGGRGEGSGEGGLGGGLMCSAVVTYATADFVQGDKELVGQARGHARALCHDGFRLQNRDKWELAGVGCAAFADSTLFPYFHSSRSGLGDNDS